MEQGRGVELSNEVQPYAYNSPHTVDLYVGTSHLKLIYTFVEGGEGRGYNYTTYTTIATLRYVG